MNAYPLMIRIEGRRCLIVGGGRVACAKARPLAEAGARVVAVAPRVAPELRALAAEIHERLFAPGDEAGAFLVFAATNDPEANAAVADCCRAAGVLCCVVDVPERGDVLTPAVVRRGDVAVAVTTQGAAPALSRRLREELDAWLPADLGGYAAFLRAARERAHAVLTDAGARKVVARELASRAGYERYCAEDAAGREAWLAALLGAHRAEGSP